MMTVVEFPEVSLSVSFRGSGERGIVLSWSSLGRLI